MIAWACVFYVGLILLPNPSSISILNAVAPELGWPSILAAWPTWDEWARVLTLRDYNTRIVVFGVAILGAGAGLVGSFTLLRKRALMGDALSHASLPGIGIAFMLASSLGGDGKSMFALLVGATLSGLLGVFAILWIRNQTRLKEDAAMGIVLSVFFGAGVAIIGVIQNKFGNVAGLEGFIYGKTASMSAMDVWLIAGASLVSVVTCLLLYKELKLLCFDESFAGSRGFSVLFLDVTLMSTVVLVTIVGLQAVGTILMIALMVIPSAAARFWTERLWLMMLISVVIGSVGCVIGALLSAVLTKMPSGATIVLVCAGFFFLSMLFGTSRGVAIRGFRRLRLNQKIERQHLLRAMFETWEQSVTDNAAGSEIPHSRSYVPISQLLPMRSWNRNRLLRAIRMAERDEMVQLRADRVRLTRGGYVEAARLTRQHRMWEMYLIAHAEVAPALVDRDADDIEHVLEPEIIDQLEELLKEKQMMIHVPKSPHDLQVNQAESS